MQRKDDIVVGLVARGGLYAGLYETQFRYGRVGLADAEAAWSATGWL